MSHDHAAKRSEERLFRLIEERTKPGADKDAIDERIWDLYGEEWSIMFTDLSGFSRHVAAFGIIHFLQLIHEHKKLLVPIIEARGGILVKSEADSLLVIFKRATNALRCAIEMQHACQEASARRVPEEKFLLCLGLGSGHILRIGDEDVYGAEVNAASKLGEDVAKAHEILVTDAFRRALGEGADADANVTFEPAKAQVAGCEATWKAVYPIEG